MSSYYSKNKALNSLYALRDQYCTAFIYQPNTLFPCYFQKRVYMTQAYSLWPHCGSLLIPQHTACLSPTILHTCLCSLSGTSQCLSSDEETVSSVILSLLRAMHLSSLHSRTLQLLSLISVPHSSTTRIYIFEGEPIVCDLHHIAISEQISRKYYFNELPLLLNSNTGKCLRHQKYCFKPNLTATQNLSFKLQLQIYIHILCFPSPLTIPC